MSPRLLINLHPPLIPLSSKGGGRIVKEGLKPLLDTPLFNRLIQENGPRDRLLNNLNQSIIGEREEDYEGCFS